MVGAVVVILLLVGCSALATQPVPEVPVATSTQEPPAATATSEPPTALPTPVPPTPTMTEQPTATPTSIPPAATIAAGQMGERLEGDEWAITVVSADNRGTEYTAEGWTQNQTLSVTQPNHHMIDVEVAMRNLTGADVGDSYITDDVKLKDGVGNEYIWEAAGVPGQFYLRGESTQSDVLSFPHPAVASPFAIHYIFQVPDDTKDLYFIWPNLTPVLLDFQ